MNNFFNFTINGLFLISFLFFSESSFSQTKINLDDFESTSGWKKIEAEQVKVDISTAKGMDNNCLRLDYNFIAGSGYGGIQKKIPLTLPDNYEFSFYIKADSPVNTLEFKLLDSEGSSVWWQNKRSFTFPKEWTKITIKQRQISKAWGPAPELKPKSIDKIEFIITSVNGGKGTVYLDKFQLTEKLAIQEGIINPILSASSSLSEENSPAKAIDGNINSSWKSSYAPANQEFFIDLKSQHEFGGLVINWDNVNYAETYNILLSDDGKEWRNAYAVTKGKGGKAFIDMRESDARYIRLSLLKSRGKGYSINEIEIKPVDFSASKNRIYELIAKDKPRGYYPKYFTPEQSYFTVAGVNSDVKETLINEEGMVETDKLNFSIEPFIYLDTKFITWNDAVTSQKLERGYLPIPSVEWKYDDITLTTKLFTDGKAGASNINLIYTLKNSGASNKKGNLFLAIRPFQVNPPSQNLNTIGGTADVNSIQYDGHSISVNKNKIVCPLIKPDGFGAVEFDEGDIVDYISHNTLPDNKSVSDHYGSASGAFDYLFDLKPGEEKQYYVIIPFHNAHLNTDSLLSDISPDKLISKKLDDNINYWQNKLDFAQFMLPASADKIINTLRSSLAYILINRDNFGFQPGSRSYERSWIRDGSMTSSSLLKMGITKEVKEYIDWYSGYQYPNGKIPCVVDTRGPDPVPENDSEGEYIFLVNQYYLFTKDVDFLRSKFENIKKTVSYIDLLTSQSKTEQHKTTDSLKTFYGLMPESISHEGYSEKPMHSYWDDFFTLKGLKDAVNIAEVLGEAKYANDYAKLRDEFKTNLYNSINLAIKNTDINYIPGCAELGDFDATSTAISLFPCNEKKNLPQPYLQNTFNKYYDFFKSRKCDSSYAWINYTPYEVRNIGAFIYMDLPSRAHEALEYFLKDQRPANWNHWAEVVWRDPKTPRFIGDMPHTWVASDYINSIRSFFVYENELDNSLVLGAGLYQDWIDSPEGMEIKNLNTYYGTINYSIRKNGNDYLFNISGSIEMPANKIRIKNFNSGKLPKSVIINGNAVSDFDSNSIIVNVFPAEIVIKY
jgi:hypothetical protein